MVWRENQAKCESMQLYESRDPCFIVINYFNVPISSDDRIFRIQFDFCSKLQPYYLIFQLSINKIKDLSSQRKWALTFLFCCQHVYFSEWSGTFHLVFLHLTRHSPHLFSQHPVPTCFVDCNFFFAIQLHKPQCFALCYVGFAVVAQWSECCA